MTCDKFGHFDRQFNCLTLIYWQDPAQDKLLQRGFLWSVSWPTQSEGLSFIACHFWSGDQWRVKVGYIISSHHSIIRIQIVWNWRLMWVALERGKKVCSDPLGKPITVWWVMLGVRHESESGVPVCQGHSEWQETVELSWSAANGPL